MKRSRLVTTLVACGVFAAAAFGIAAIFSEAAAGPRCVCPAVYSPVRCSNGKTYSNLCYANCAHATGCEPIWVPPPPIE
jgi:hypothetical protein